MLSYARKFFLLLTGVWLVVAVLNFNNDWAFYHALWWSAINVFLAAECYIRMQANEIKDLKRRLKERK